ncbi:MAG: hypothetical protein EB832_05915 [Thaumarchaeota archaeon S14]|nr:MAG: hypothetical protein EB832_05915 [Thaumarchaeota archaeon S14]
MDDEPAGDWEYDGHEFFTDTAWRGISISQWSAERHADRAKTILATAGLVLTVMTVGLVGLAEVLGVNLENPEGLNRLFHGFLAPLLVVGLFGIVSVLASMVFSTVALRSLGADNIGGSEELYGHWGRGGGG